MTAENIRTIEHTLRGMVRMHKVKKSSLLELLLKISEYQQWLEENRYIPSGHFIEVLNAVLATESKQNKKRHAH